MSLKNCPECGNQVSNKATKCPHCGAPLKTDSTGGCCGCGCLLMIIFFFLPVFFPKTNFDQKNTTATQENVSKQTEEKQTVKKEKTVKISETVSVGYWSYCVWSKEWTSKFSNNEFINQAPNYKYLKISITVRNNAKDASTLPPIKLVDENGNEYDESSKTALAENAFNVLEKINPTLQKQGYIYFDVPTNRNYKLKVSGGFWSSESAYIELY